MEKIIEKAMLVGVCLNKDDKFENSMKELGDLAAACDMEVVVMLTQNLEKPNNSLYVGSGKVKEIKETIEEFEVDVVIFDNALSPYQIRNLTKELELPIWDRTSY